MRDYSVQIKAQLTTFKARWLMKREKYNKQNGSFQVDEMLLVDNK